MQTESKNVGPEAPSLPCPQCRSLAPVTEKKCPACGAEMHAVCPVCGTPRGAEDAFCRSCGFNFSLRKLRLKDQADDESGPQAAAGRALPRIGFHKPAKRYAYRMDPRRARFRAFLVLIFLLLIAAAVFTVFNVIWGNLSVQDLLKWYHSAAAAVTDRVQVADQNAAPDWKVRSQYWMAYYRDVFVLPPTNAAVEVILTTGAREQGALVRVASGCVVLQQAGKNSEYPRLTLDEATRRIFFRDEFATFNARNRVRAEKAEWEQKNKAPAAGEKPAAESSPAPATGAVAAAAAFLDVKCPACAGMGYLVAAAGAGPMPGEGSKWTPGGVALQEGGAGKSAAAPAGKQTCPVCGGKGLRRFERAPDYPWPAGAARCGTCRGMGKALVKSAQGINQGLPCAVCEGRGFVVNQYDAAQNVPPKYE